MIVSNISSIRKTTILEVLTETMSELNNNEKGPKWKVYRLKHKAVENEYLLIQKIEDIYILGLFTMIWKNVVNVLRHIINKITGSFVILSLIIFWLKI